MYKQLLKDIQSELDAQKTSKPLKLYGLTKREDLTYALTTPLKIKGDGIIIVDGTEYSVTVDTENGTSVITGMDECTKGFIREANLYQDQTAMLRKIQESLETFKPTELVEKIFCEWEYPQQDKLPELPELNVSQQLVVAQAISNPITITIGPGGTGKTKTMVSLIDQLQKQGERVLVASHANLAVEGVFAGVLKNYTPTKDGEVVLSIQTENPLLQKYSPKDIKANIAQDLKDEIETLEDMLMVMSQQKRVLEAELYPSQTKLQTDMSISATRKREIDLIDSEVAAFRKEIQQLQKRIDKLSNNSFINSLATLLSSTKLDDIKRELIQVEDLLASKIQTLATLNKKHNELQIEMDGNIKKSENFVIELRTLKEEETLVRNRIKELKENVDNLTSQNPISEANLAGATLMSIALNKAIKDAKFDTLIVDEGSMANLPALLLAMNVVTKRIIIFGDPMQLSPIAKTLSLKKSIFDILGITESFIGGVLHPKSLMLDTQFRCHADIAKLSSSLFYGGLLKNGREFSAKKSLYIKRTDLENGVGYRAENGSFVNDRHRSVIINQVRQALERGQRSIGVISPFKAQANAIEIQFHEELAWQYPDADFKAATIHAFQGQEKDIVIFDFTFGPNKSGYGLPQMLLGDITSDAAKLLNVATSRARDFFILVIDLKFTHKALEGLPNSKDQVVSQWLKEIENLAFS